MSVFTKASASRSARAASEGARPPRRQRPGSHRMRRRHASAGRTSRREAGDTAHREGERDLTLKIGTHPAADGRSHSSARPRRPASDSPPTTSTTPTDSGLSVEIVCGDSGDTDNKAYATDGHRPALGRGLRHHRRRIVRRVEAVHRRDHRAQASSSSRRPTRRPTSPTWDDNGLYWRTAPSDVLQGEVLGNLIAEDGHETLGILYLNDSYGTGLASSPRRRSRLPVARSSQEYLTTRVTPRFDAQISDAEGRQPRRDRADHVRPARSSCRLCASGYPGDQLYLVDGNLSDYCADFAAGLVAGCARAPCPVSTRPRSVTSPTVWPARATPS